MFQVTKEVTEISETMFPYKRTSVDKAPVNEEETKQKTNDHIWLAVAAIIAKNVGLRYTYN